MISLSYESLMGCLALFTALCVAGGWLIRIIKGIKKPGDDIIIKLDRDNKRLVNLEEEIDYVGRSISLLMKSNLVILGHLQSNNNTGEMTKMEQEIQDFLIQN